MQLSALAADRMPLAEDNSTHGLFNIDDFLSDEPIRRRQGTISPLVGPRHPTRLGHRIDEIPDPRSTESQTEPDEPGYEAVNNPWSEMPDYGVNDEEEKQESGAVYRGHKILGAKPELGFQQSELEPTATNLGVSGPEPEDTAIRPARQPRPSAKAWKDFADPERSWKTHRPRQYIGESLSQSPTIKKDGIYVFDKDDDWPILVKVLEIKGDQAKVQLTAGFRTDPRGGAVYWVSTRDLKPDRI